jgi:hypothetical protein
MLIKLTAKTISPRPLRIFTEDFAPTLLSLRLPLKNWEQGLAYSSYQLPFSFDKSKFFNYRLEAKCLDLSFDREQRKYMASYDLGSKKHLTISANYFMSFRRYGSFGKITYNRLTMANFFKTLNSPSSLYFPEKHLLRPQFSLSYAWYLENVYAVIRKRFLYYRKIQAQSFDLDLTVSSQHASLKTTFLPLLPTRYNSFFLSSFTNNKPLRFPFRYFRYFHKYNLRKGF